MAIPLKALSALSLEGFSADTCTQLVPPSVECQTNGNEEFELIYPPTAQMLFEEVAATAFKGLVEPTVTVIGVVLHADPFQWIRVPVSFVSEKLAPTAQASSGPISVTPKRSF